MKNDMNYELVVIWEDGSKNVHQYRTEEDAEKGANNMKMAFGNQITWVGTRPIL